MELIILMVDQTKKEEEEIFGSIKFNEMNNNQIK
jgi:hypothetical protein